MYIETHSCLFTSKGLQVKPKFLIEMIHCIIYHLGKLSEMSAMNPSYLSFQLSFSEGTLEDSKRLGVTGALLKKQVTKKFMVHCLNLWWLGSCLPFAVCVSGFPERGTTHTMMSPYFISNLKT